MTIQQLFTAYYQWTGQSEIQNTAEYADTGFMLAAEFAARERPHMAENCAARARQYQQLATLLPSVRRVPFGKSFILLEAMEQSDNTLAM